MRTLTWEIITGEYPPQTGGVGDYAKNVARGLAALGDTVRVWKRDLGGTVAEDAGVSIRTLPDCFGKLSRKILARDLKADSIVLIQYVPQLFGRRGVNVSFCYWLYSKTRAQIWIVFHEVAVKFQWRQPLRTAPLALAHSAMLIFAARSAKQAWVTIPAWKRSVEKASRGNTSIGLLPVPSPVEDISVREKTAEIRRTLTGGMKYLVGHFGTYRQDHAALLQILIPQLLDAIPAQFLLLGDNSVQFREALIDSHPHLAPQIVAMGHVPPDALSNHLKACDLMIQIYPDGVSGRRTSTMACLAHGCAVITNDGSSTEEFWKSCKGLQLSKPGPDYIDFVSRAKKVLDDPLLSNQLRSEALRVYKERFDIGLIVSTLRASALKEPAPDRSSWTRSAGCANRSLQ
jgi:glycosyltransferase involved in cell wall biosynthesis